jgi:hypothetical protein
MPLPEAAAKKILVNINGRRATIQTDDPAMPLLSLFAMTWACADRVSAVDWHSVGRALYTSTERLCVPV